MHVITNANFSYPFQPSKLMQEKSTYIFMWSFIQLTQIKKTTKLQEICVTDHGFQVILQMLDSPHAYLNFTCLQHRQCIWSPIMFLAVSEYDAAMIGQSLQWSELHHAKLINKVNKVSLAQVGKKPPFLFPSATGEKIFSAMYKMFSFSLGRLSEDGI